MLDSLRGPRAIAALPRALHDPLLPAVRGAARARGGPAGPARAGGVPGLPLRLLPEPEGGGRDDPRAGRANFIDPACDRPQPRVVDVSGRFRRLRRERDGRRAARDLRGDGDRKSTRLNSSHLVISYAVFCLKKKKKSARIKQDAIK